jgi:2-oxoglutarate ferredoxin oxidoreductase subunit beta
MGTIEDPFVPGQLVLGAGGTFFARCVDNNLKHSQEVFEEAARFKGTSVVEVLQNCVIFNDGVHEAISDPKTREEHQIFLKHGEPMIFGNNKDKGITMEKGKLKVVQIGEGGANLEDILIHDSSDQDGFLQQSLINMKLPDFPVAMGVIRAVPSKVYNEAMDAQIAEAKAKSKITSIDQLLSSGNTWRVE